MIPLFRDSGRGIEGGAPIPAVWETMRDNDITFFRSDVSMVAGPAGSGKSILALQQALEARVPTLYISCDMGPSLLRARAAALLSGERIKDVQKELTTLNGREKYTALLAERVNHLYLAYESRPSPEEIREIELAYEMLWGVPPELLVIDNLMNLFSGSENEWTGLRDLSQVFHYFAQELTTHVMLLHHTNIAGQDLSKPAGLGQIKGQITELPAVILTVAKGPGTLRVAPVKNRHGKSSPTGSEFFELGFEEEYGRLRDIPPEPQFQGNAWMDRMALR